MIIKMDKYVGNCIYEERLEKSKGRYAINKKKNKIWAKSNVMMGFKFYNGYI